MVGIQNSTKANIKFLLVIYCLCSESTSLLCWKLLCLYWWCCCCCTLSLYTSLLEIEFFVPNCKHRKYSSVYSVRTIQLVGGNYLSIKQSLWSIFFFFCFLNATVRSTSWCYGSVCIKYKFNNNNSNYK